MGSIVSAALVQERHTPKACIILNLCPMNESCESFAARAGIEGSIYKLLSHSSRSASPWFVITLSKSVALLTFPGC